MIDSTGKKFDGFFQRASTGKKSRELDRSRGSASTRDSERSVHSAMYRSSHSPERSSPERSSVQSLTMVLPNGEVMTRPNRQSPWQGMSVYEGGIGSDGFESGSSEEESSDGGLGLTSTELNPEEIPRRETPESEVPDSLVRSVDAKVSDYTLDLADENPERIPSSRKSPIPSSRKSSSFTRASTSSRQTRTKPSWNATENITTALSNDNTFIPRKRQAQSLESSYHRYTMPGDVFKEQESFQDKLRIKQMEDHVAHLQRRLSVPSDLQDKWAEYLDDLEKARNQSKLNDELLRTSRQDSEYWHDEYLWARHLIEKVDANYRGTINSLENQLRSSQYQRQQRRGFEISVQTSVTCASMDEYEEWSEYCKWRCQCEIRDRELAEREVRFMRSQREMENEAHDDAQSVLIVQQASRNYPATETIQDGQLTPENSKGKTETSEVEGLQTRYNSPLSSRVSTLSESRRISLGSEDVPESLEEKVDTLEHAEQYFPHDIPGNLEERMEITNRPEQYSPHESLKEEMEMPEHSNLPATHGISLIPEEGPLPDTHEISIIQESLKEEIPELSNLPATHESPVIQESVKEEIKMPEHSNLPATHEISLIPEEGPLPATHEISIIQEGLKEEMEMPEHSNLPPTTGISLIHEEGPLPATRESSLIQESVKEGIPEHSNMPATHESPLIRESLKEEMEIPDHSNLPATHESSLFPEEGPLIQETLKEEMKMPEHSNLFASRKSSLIPEEGPLPATHEISIIQESPKEEMETPEHSNLPATHDSPLVQETLKEEMEMPEHSNLLASHKSSLIPEEGPLPATSEISLIQESPKEEMETPEHSNLPATHESPLIQESVKEGMEMPEHSNLPARKSSLIPEEDPLPATHESPLIQESVKEEMEMPEHSNLPAPRKSSLIPEESPLPTIYEISTPRKSSLIPEEDPLPATHESPLIQESLKEEMEMPEHSILLTPRKSSLIPEEGPLPATHESPRIQKSVKKGMEMPDDSELYFPCESPAIPGSPKEEIANCPEPILHDRQPVPESPKETHAEEYPMALHESLLNEFQRDLAGADNVDSDSLFPIYESTARVSPSESLTHSSESDGEPKRAPSYIIRQVMECNIGSESDDDETAMISISPRADAVNLLDDLRESQSDLTDLRYSQREEWESWWSPTEMIQSMIKRTMIQHE